uniref:Wuschel-like homeobox 11A n=1 Tax=Selaginella kraussiana TaxID=81964 RepID=A0A0P0KZL2_9TRAC|nr:wuschel-like homeobox 11A [Selaginella kraussiana]
MPPRRNRRVTRPLSEQQLEQQEGELLRQHIRFRDFVVDPMAVHPNPRREEDQQRHSQKRWCPTPEQKECLEAFYHNGDYSSSRIPEITEHVSRFGQVEKCRVYYWFQNRKSRDKRRAARAQTELENLLQQEEAAPEEQPVVVQAHQEAFGAAAEEDHHPIVLEGALHPGPGLPPLAIDEQQQQRPLAAASTSYAPQPPEYAGATWMAYPNDYHMADYVQWQNLNGRGF